MAKRKNLAPAAAVETAATSSVELEGRTFLLKFTLEGMGVARTKLRKLGIQVNLMGSLNMDDLDADTIKPLFYGAIQDAHPEITYEEVRTLCTFENYGLIFSAICAAYIGAMHPHKKEPSVPDPREGAAS